MALVDPRSEVAIFILIATEKQITIFELASGIAVVAIFIGLFEDSRHARYARLQFMELLEERSSKIKLSTKIFLIPSVAVPLLIFVDRERFIRGIARDHLLTREVALAVKERTFVSPRKARLHAASGAELRWGYCIFLPCKNRGDLVIEREITRSDLVGR